MDWWGFKATSMICRPLTRSMRRLDYFDYRAASSSSVLRAFDPAPPLLIELMMLIGEKVKPQTIARPALDVMTLPLPADKTEVEALDDPARGLPSTTHVSTECRPRSRNARLGSFEPARVPCSHPRGRIASPYSRACPHGVTSNASTMMWASLEVVVPLTVITRV